MISAERESPGPKSVLNDQLTQVTGGCRKTQEHTVDLKITRELKPSKTWIKPSKNGDLAFESVSHHETKINVNKPKNKIDLSYENLEGKHQQPKNGGL